MEGLILLLEYGFGV